MEIPEASKGGQKRKAESAAKQRHGKHQDIELSSTSQVQLVKRRGHSKRKPGGYLLVDGKYTLGKQGQGWQDKLQAIADGIKDSSITSVEDARQKLASAN